MVKQILITGATSGIGEATAKYLHAEGYGMVLTGRNKEKLAWLKNFLGDQVEVVAADLSDNTGVERIFTFCQEKGVMLDGLVHSAGIGGAMPIKLCDEKFLNHLMQIHYFAFIELCRFFYKRKISHDGASIIAVSSVANWICAKTSAPYACAKSAVDTAVTIMSKEFLKRKIRVNAVKPAIVNTPLVGITERTQEEVYHVQPLGDIEPEYIAFMIEYLLSDKAKYITGAHIPISAGMEL